ncbi:MAG TPA: YciI family protein [Acetobacteraceae bacterium]|jgi:hypothetical protein|nr:YciI family protein [Acetobacteraceae bacterium]
MEYMLLVYSEETALKSVPQEQVQGIVDAYTAYTQALRDANVLRGANRLRPTSAATTVRVANGRTQALDGPFAETKEQLGGYYMIDVPDLDAALAWAARCPGAQYGSIEVRPIWSM